MNMVSANKTCHQTLFYCTLRCWGTAWIIVGLFFLITGSIFMANGEQQYLGMVIVSIFFIMLGSFTWYYLLKFSNIIKNSNSILNSEDTDGSIIPKKRTVASALLMFGSIFDSIGSMAYASNGFTDFDNPDLEPLWPINIVWPISSIPIWVALYILLGIDVYLKNLLEFVRKCLGRPETATSVSPQINSIKIQSAKEPHTAITIPPPVYTPPPQANQSNFYFFK